MAERAKVTTESLDRRSRLPAPLDVALCTPTLTATVLARWLRVAPQTATALLRDLLAADVVHEFTGRKHFRAFGARRTRIGQMMRRAEFKVSR